MSADALLDAGAVLPAGTPADADTVDSLTTRAYRHPVLGERVVVRLVPGTLGQAEDLTMEFLGFDAPEHVDDVGIVRQQALGFPAWALVHDPANGHHALALVKEIERLVRVAKSRIGPAKEGFDALGERLARSVPHFLPTFYEEAARAFLAADSPTYAASMFGKARDAERSFALTIDEDRQHTVFLEFALAGAITAKALSAHARNLQTRSDPATAYDRFRRLCLERTLGGLPPYAAMHTDLRRLAKNAKLGADAEDALMRDMLAAPAIGRAPGAFWTAYQPALVRVATADPAVRGQLLGIIPSACPDAVWLELLEATGATAALTEPAGSGPAAADSPDGPAGWLARFDVHRDRWRRVRLPLLYALAHRMAARLIADGVPVPLCRDHRSFDLDLVDTCLTAGVPITAPDDPRCDVDRWLADETEGRRDLTAVAAHPGLVPALAQSAENRLQAHFRQRSTPDVERIAELAAVPGIRTALHWWLTNLAEQITGPETAPASALESPPASGPGSPPANSPGSTPATSPDEATPSGRGLATVGAEVDRFACVACPEGRALNPEAVTRIGEHRFGGTLARTLRAGVFDEFGWPALESAAATLSGDPAAAFDDHRFQTVQQWPQLVLRADDQVVVVDGDEVALTHLLRIPADQRSYLWRTVLRFADGQLLVCWDRGPDRAGYWSGTPDDVFTSGDNAFTMWRDQLSLALPGGGRTAGGRPLRAGDHAAEERGVVVGDGSHYWTFDDDQWHELDVATGRLGRASMPAFFEAGAVDGARLVTQLCRLLPAPAATAASPLGQHDGLVGWRVRESGDGQVTGEGVDGRTFTASRPVGRRATQAALSGAIRFPGAGDVAGLLHVSAYRNSHVLLRTRSGDEFASVAPGLRPNPFASGTVLVPPPAYWHFLRPRDGAGSAVLRAVTDEHAERLLSTVEGAADDDAVRKLVGDAFPGVTHPALLAGIAGIVTVAAELTARLGALTAQVRSLEPAAAPAPSECDGLPHDAVLREVLGGLIPHCYDNSHQAAHLFGKAGPVLAGLSADDVRHHLVAADEDWFSVLSALPAALHRAVSPLTTPEQREALLGLFEIIGGSGLLADGARTRRMWLVADEGTPEPQPGDVLILGTRRVAVVSTRGYHSTVSVIEHAPDGAFGPVPGYTMRTQRVFDTRGLTGSRVLAFVAAARAHGPLPLRPELARTLAAAAGMSVADAAHYLLNPADLKAWTEHRPEAWPAALEVTDAALEAAVLSMTDPARRATRMDAYAALLPDDLATLWSDGPRIDRLAAWWTERYGARRPVPDALIVDLYRERIATGLSPTELLHGYANVATCRWLAGPDDNVTNEALVRSTVRVLPWLSRRLPADDPIRQVLPEVLARTRARVGSPGFTLRVGSVSNDAVPKLLAALGLTGTVDEHGTDAGVVHIGADGYMRPVQVRPARLHGIDDPILAALRAHLGGSAEIAALRFLLGPHLDAWVAVPETATEEDNDPSRSAPALVAEAAATYGIGADAATLYLQLLALPDPTDRNVAAWTGWKPARLTKARAELAATDLVVAAKRTRAGRTLFLPGGWLALKTPHLPLERWKLPLLLADGDAVHELGAIIPIAPVPHLFTLAWARVAAGDTPRFEELTTGGRR